MDSNSDCPRDEKPQPADQCLVLRECLRPRSAGYSSLPASSTPTGPGRCFAGSECCCSSMKPPRVLALLSKSRPRHWELPQLLFCQADRALKKGSRYSTRRTPCARWEQMSSSCATPTLVRHT